PGARDVAPGAPERTEEEQHGQQERDRRAALAAPLGRQPALVDVVAHPDTSSLFTRPTGPAKPNEGRAPWRGAWPVAEARRAERDAVPPRGTAPPGSRPRGRRGRRRTSSPPRGAGRGRCCAWS